MDGKGEEGTYNFYHDNWGSAGGQGIGHRGAAAPCHPAGAAHGRGDKRGRLHRLLQNSLILQPVLRGGRSWASVKN